MNNIPKILWINLDKDTERKKYIEDLCNKYTLKNKRIVGFNGDNYNNFCILNQKNINIGEIGCFCSHLKALEYFTTFVNDNYCLIAEDDISFEYLTYWKKNFWDYINEVKEFDIIQLSQIYSLHKIRKYKIQCEDIKVIKHEKNFYGCGCYLITKKGAKKIIDSIPKIDNKYDLRNIKQIIIDSYIYENLNSYTIPLFTTNTDFKSNIHQDHIKRIHIPSKEIITNLWKKNKIYSNAS
jgi:GR25 family glycosyltransferase involved in LPS biosynthesis